MTRGVTAVWVWALLGLSACGGSEADNGASAPPPSTSGGTSASTGGGSGGSVTSTSSGAASAGGAPAGAGSSGSPANGGSAGSAGTTGAAGTSSLAPLRDACRAYVAAYCEKQEECSSGRDRAAPCIEYNAQQCPDLLMSPGTGHSLQNLLDCVEPMRTADCADWRRDIQPACVTPGLRKKNEPCVYRSQCESSHCNKGSDAECGSCSGVAEPGGACNGYDTVCPQGQACVEQVCTDIPVTPDPEPPPPPVVRDAEGAACRASTCQADLYCALPEGGGAGVCRSLPKPGDPCHSGPFGPRCAPGASCKDEVCAELPVAGQPCTYDTTALSFCAKDHTCVGGVCEPLGDVGASCRPSALVLVQNTCRSELVCACLDDECRTGACQELAREGSACGVNRVCEHGTVCEAGVCQPSDALTSHAICDRRG